MSSTSLLITLASLELGSICCSITAGYLYALFWDFMKYHLHELTLCTTAMTHHAKQARHIEPARGGVVALGRLVLAGEAHAKPAAAQPSQCIAIPDFELPH